MGPRCHPARVVVFVLLVQTVVAFAHRVVPDLVFSDESHEHRFEFILGDKPLHHPPTMPCFVRKALQVLSELSETGQFRRKSHTEGDVFNYRFEYDICPESIDPGRMDLHAEVIKYVIFEFIATSCLPLAIHFAGISKEFWQPVQQHSDVMEISRYLWRDHVGIRRTYDTQ